LLELFGLKAIGYGLIYTVVSILTKYVTGNASSPPLLTLARFARAHLVRAITRPPGVFARSIDEGHIVGWAMVRSLALRSFCSLFALCGLCGCAC
jgi:hypothetical protein